MWQQSSSSALHGSMPVVLCCEQVKDVRDVARDAAALMTDLVEYGRGGGSTAGWAQHASDKLSARGAHLAQQSTCSLQHSTDWMSNG